MDDNLAEKMHALEAELIRLNQVADLAERLYVNGLPEEYVVDCLIAHSRKLRQLFYDVWGAVVCSKGG